MNLFVASIRGNLDRVRELLSVEPEGKGADPNIANPHGRTPLYGASFYDHLEIVRELLRAGADPNITDTHGTSPLYLASEYGYPEVVKELLRTGADPNLVDIHGETALIAASREDHSEIIELLETYFPSLFILSLRSTIKFRINISSIPEVVLE